MRPLFFSKHVFSGESGSSWTEHHIQQMQPIHMRPLINLLLSPQCLTSDDLFFTHKIFVAHTPPSLRLLLALGKLHGCSLGCHLLTRISSFLLLTTFHFLTKPPKSACPKIGVYSAGVGCMGGFGLFSDKKQNLLAEGRGQFWKNFRRGERTNSLCSTRGMASPTFEP